MRITDIVSFGDWVQQRRLALDLTRSELARRINCSASMIKKIERDERRPSRQLAELLADQLATPKGDRARFLDFARGEFVSSPPSPPDQIPLPSFLWTPENADKRNAPLLVARERELDWLDSHLEAALGGKGGIVFISGEAGDGKTMLAQEFIRQSQEKHPGLVVANGNCNAYTGIGDPYLPFREVLELLTGDIEGQWLVGAMSRAYAERLWGIVPHTVQALLDVGPDLVDTFLLGPSLLARATAATAAHGQEMLDQLQDLVNRHQSRQSPAHLQQGNLFAQYARVLQSLARRQPLLLVIDDLQWADVGSISLLFHLSRHLRGQRILLVGIYRAAEVALGRVGERHPLEPLLNELQRSFGDIHVHLNQAEGRRFVDALVDSEPNRLGQSFRDALYRQTGGHPLFTVEMLHGLQARGDLLQNEDGEWSASPSLAWEIVPARVEGIVKERVDRLPLPLRELLQVASVAGETFSPEIIAQVQGSDERRAAAQFGALLGQQYQLINVQGSQQIGGEQLPHYRFRHILFQQYIYNGLDAIQRAYLHRAIAEALVQRYGDEANLIAPQLARHYAIAGDNQRAVDYYGIAGDMAAAVYANAEAETHYRRALALAQSLSNASGQQLHGLYTRLGRTLELAARYDQAVALYAEMETVAQGRGDPAMVLAALLARATIRTTVNFARDPVRAQVLLERARVLARELGDQRAEARILWNLLILSAYTGGDREERLVVGEQALALARQVDLPEQLALTLHDSFYAYAGINRWEQARTALYAARDLWQELGNLPMLSETLMRLHWTYLVTGDYEQAIAYAEEAYRLGQESHNLDAQALSHFMSGFIHWERGEIDQALAVMEEDIAVAETVNSLTPLTGTLADLGLLYGELGDIDHGLSLAKRAHSTAEERLPILRCWSHAILVTLHLLKGDHAAATELMTTLTDYRMVKARFGYMPFMWIRVGLAQGEFALAQGDFDQVVALMDELYNDLVEAGIGYLRPDVLHLKGRALFALSQETEAHEALLEARAAAEALGSRRALEPILDSLSELVSL